MEWADADVVEEEADEEEARVEVEDIAEVIRAEDLEAAEEMVEEVKGMMIEEEMVMAIDDKAEEMVEEADFEEEVRDGDKYFL